VNDQEPNNMSLVPSTSDNKLSLSGEIISRGLRLATEIESQQKIEKSQKLIRYFRGLSSPSQITFSKNGQFAAITGDGAVFVKGECLEDVVIWNIFNGEISILSALDHGFTNLGQGGKIWDLALSSTGELALVGYDDGDILCWNVKSNEVLYRITGSRLNEPVCCLKFLPDDQHFVYAHIGLNMRIHETKSGKYLKAINHTGGTKIAKFSSDGGKLLVYRSMFRKPLTLIDVLAENELSYFNNSSTVHAFAIFPDGQKVLSQYCDGIITLWNSHNGEEILNWHFNSNKESSCPVNEKHPGWRNTDTKSGTKKTHQLRGRRSCPFESLDVSHDGNYILSGDDDGYMRLWTSNGDEIFNYSHTNSVIKVAFLPDNQHLVSGCFDGSVYLWELPVHPMGITDN